MIQAGVGISTETSAARAAVEAARQAMEGLDGQAPAWCVAFATSEHAEHLETLLRTLAEALGTPYIVGCSTSGILAPDTEIEDRAALGVLAVASDQIRATPFLFQDTGDNGLTAGVRLGQRLVNSHGSDDLLLVWPDPLHVRPDRLLQSIDAVLGGIPVVGGAASSRSADQATIQFCGVESSSAAVSGVRLGGRFRHAIGVTQGCSPLGAPLRVTRAHENLILELDGRPALDALRERAPAGLFSNLDCAFEFLFVGLLPDPHEAGHAPGEYLVRNIVAADPDTGLLAVADRVEEGQHIVFARREAKAAREDLRGLLERVSPERTELDYRFGLYFNCRARGRSLYKADGIDASMLARALPGVPILGLFSNAEIGPLRGRNELFTYTGVLLLIAE